MRAPSTLLARLSVNPRRAVAKVLVVWAVTMFLVGAATAQLQVDFTATPMTGAPPLLVKFKATVTGGNPLSYSWDFGDGSTAFGANKKAPKHTYWLPGSYTVSVVVQDFSDTDIETKPELITVVESPGGQSANFEVHRVGPRAAGASSALIVDLDGDGHKDVLYTAKQLLAWRRNLDSSGGFGALRVIMTDKVMPGQRRLAATDMDGDGDMDVLAGHFDPSFPLTSRKLGWYANEQGHFRPPTIVVQGWPDFEFFMPGDFDSDGDSDLLVKQTNGPMPLYTLKHLGGGQFGPKHGLGIVLAHAVDDVDMADVDGDGDLDLLLSRSSGGSSLHWLDNVNGEGLFVEHQIIDADSLVEAQLVDFADVDGDGVLDVVAAYKKAPLMRWFGYSSQAGTFTTETTLLTIGGTRALDHGDVDVDGDVDLLASTLGWRGLVWRENTDGTGSFAWPAPLGMNSLACETVAVGDLDGDAALDVVSACRELELVVWYEGPSVAPPGG